MAKTAFITGASGFIGSHLVAELDRKQWQLRLLQHSTAITSRGQHEIISGDLSAPASYRSALDGVDVVFHLAAVLGASLLDEAGFQQINVTGTERLLEAAWKAGVKQVVHFSSAGVLGQVTAGETADEAYPCNPQNAYDRTKLAAEEMALAAARKGQSVIVVRPGWVYGPGDRRTFKLIRAIARKRFLLVTKGSAWQTPVFVQDLIQGVLLCSEHGKEGEIYHLAGDEVLTVRRMVETVAAGLETRIPPIHLPLTPTRLAAWVLETSFRLFKREAPLTMGKLAFFIHPKPLAIHKAKTEC
ncbi:MAG: NAD-dependent epimerase/dehydratase family protein, partial [Candidatus Aminicenantes bacterium]|nr:NAD-dependent epimerase/dehydratase family protein [Candidatus Aminicenantes bacterium]